ncbi:DUF2867 domain-containing protein [Ideonella livida]|uniref:DUF2867 domain-containing protein n=1 Tax=Ideonella livida TaxID=2707176 RepID=UPI001940236E|nr:DUF2867 domain-containing protein [Ideonella livida]
MSAASYRDSHRAPLTHPSAGVVDLFFAVFGHHPAWMKAAIRARNRVVRALGLQVPAESNQFDGPRRAAYRVGDTIGRWPIFLLNEQELIAGRDSSHLDFRVSVLRQVQDGQAWVTISTVCKVHNRFGKAYLRCVLPFHRPGLKFIIRRAMRAGRL